jgi:tRNA U34 5-carboxymethylaminomethyl modifying GTPase MnmE/TrmE
LILLLLDNSDSTEQLTPGLIESISGKLVLTVLNKSDLPCRFKSENLSNIVNIIAKSGTGIDRLCSEIKQLAGVENFDINQPVCFTTRQEQILKKLTAAKSQNAAQSIIVELLSGPTNV